MQRESDTQTLASSSVALFDHRSNPAVQDLQRKESPCSGARIFCTHIGTISIQSAMQLMHTPNLLAFTEKHPQDFGFKMRKTVELFIFF